MADGLPTWFEMPGEGFNFQDVTSLFERAGGEMEPEEILMMDDFTLQDAMSALEIGEPTLDTGFIAEGQAPPPFDPLAPLLPEEVCWILDRAMGYEMEFHSGGMLAHTVYTLLYVHHLHDMDPDVVLKWMPQFTYDYRKPIVLITIVLRTAVQALLKCVDLTWRELANGDMYDTEDWQSDKCEVGLLEGIPTNFILQKLDAAIRSVSQSPHVPGDWKSALTSRLLLRQTLLKLMSVSVPKYQHEFIQLIVLARGYLRAIKSGPPPPTPSPSSQAFLAFDPHVGRQLQMATPIRVVISPSLENTCRAVELFLDGLYDVCLLSGSERLSTWQTAADLQAWSSDVPVRLPYVRSLTQTVFYERSYASKQYSSAWLLNQFFYETCGMDYDRLRTIILERWMGDHDIQFVTMERFVVKVMTGHVKALFSNPCRRRRKFMKQGSEWHQLYEILTEIKNHIDLERLPKCDVLNYFPDIALIWRLSTLRDIVLSGFQLELYSAEEKAFAYWYSVEIINEHLKSLDNLLAVTPEGSETQTELYYQAKFLTLLQSICTALFLVTISLVSFDWERTRPNFFRRYKWAFRQDPERLFQLPVIAQPELHKFIRLCGEILHHRHHNTNGDANHAAGVLAPEHEAETSFLSPAEYIELGAVIAKEMVKQNESGSWSGMWAANRMKLIQGLLNVCTNLSGLPRTLEEMDVFDVKKRLRWDPAFNPWFPKLLPP